MNTESLLVLAFNHRYSADDRTVHCTLGLLQSIVSNWTKDIEYYRYILVDGVAYNSATEIRSLLLIIT